MILVILRVMALGLWRDRAGLVLVFVLPPLVFFVFASVFGAGANARLDVRAGVVDQIASNDSRQLVAGLRSRLDGRLSPLASVAALEDTIESGEADAGLVLQGDLAATPSPITVLVHPGRKAAGEVLAAQIGATASQDLPELMLRREIAQLSTVLALTPGQLRHADETPAGPVAAPSFVAQQVLLGGNPLVIYYAGAVSILFLMFTAMQGAIGLIDERRSGLRLRLGLSTGGVAPLFAGRMVWLIALGVVQALVLFAAAAAAYGVPLEDHVAAWSATALAAAAASAGIALALAAACQTREQAQTISTFLFLILAAVGGSMAPRFLMPAALQNFGWLTPHTWVIEAYEAILWRGLVNATVLQAWGVLFGFALVGFLAALWIEGRRRL